MSDQDHFKKSGKGSALGKVLRSLLVMAVLAIILAGAAVFYAQTVFVERGPLSGAKIITVERGMRTAPIAQMLVAEGVISSPGIFMAATYVFRSSRGNLKAGEFEIPAGASMAEVLRLLQVGKSLAYKVTIPEGWTTQKALERIAGNKVLIGDITVKPPEGSLLPDTYVFQRGTTRDALVKRMTAAQKKLLDKLWDKRQKNLPVKTRAEVLTLASIVERETGIGAERAKVAGVFVNRLNKKMRLQSDPTIIYGIVGGKGRMDRPISKKDIATKTAYNTYQIDGLPPAPIANPGRAAIIAVLNPTKTDAFYFVADGTGGHAFAKTLKEHEANVAKWRKIERQKKKAANGKAANGKAANGKADKRPTTAITPPGKAKP